MDIENVDIYELLGAMENVEIVFENLESIIIPRDKVSYIEFGVIKKDFRDDSCRSDKLVLHIEYSDESDLVYDGRDYEKPLGMYTSNFTSNHVNDRPNILGRILNYDDIVCLSLLDDDNGLLATVYTPWKGDFDYNELMSTEYGEGVLKINISDN